MKFSIVTVAFNGASTLPTALESVWRQLRADFEIEHVVVDGGSKDGTVALLQAHAARVSETPGFSFGWTSEPDDGLYDAMNKGVARATGDVIGILNADDVLAADDVLMRVAAAFRGMESLDCVFGNVRFVDASTCPDAGLDDLRALRTRRVCFARRWRPWMLQWGYMPPHPAIFIRRVRFSDWRGYVPSRKEYRIAADYELLIRYFCRNRMSYRYTPVCVTTMRMGGVSTRDVEARRKLNAEIIKGNRVNGYFCCWPMLLPKYAVKIWEVLLPKLGLIH